MSNNPHPHIDFEVLGYNDDSPHRAHDAYHVGSVHEHRPQGQGVIYQLRYRGSEAQNTAEDCLQRMCRQCYPASYDLLDERKTTQ